MATEVVRKTAKRKRKIPAEDSLKYMQGHPGDHSGPVTIRANKEHERVSFQCGHMTVWMDKTELSKIVSMLCTKGSDLWPGMWQTR